MQYGQLDKSTIFDTFKGEVLVEIRPYITPEGDSQFLKWLESLDRLTRMRINVQIDRVARGQSHNVEPVGDQVSEIKMNFGSGYRVYFSRVNNVMILLLIGGDKRSQTRDILKAKRYWRHYAKTQ